MTEATTSLGETIDTDDRGLRLSTARELGDHVLATLDLPGMPQYVAGNLVLMLEQLAAFGSPGAMRALCRIVDDVQPYTQLWNAQLWTHPDLMGVTPTAPPPAPPTPAAARPGVWARYVDHASRRSWWTISLSWVIAAAAVAYLGWTW